MRAILISALLALAPPGGQTHQWDTYANPRFGTRLTYPSDLFASRVESDNGDGVTMSAADGATLAVFGAHNATEATPAQYVRGLVRGGGRYSHISYRLVRPRLAILSGTSGGKIFYERYSFLSDGTIHAFVLQYPLAARSRYDGLVARISASLR
jgi:hypothetical protein